MSTINISGIAIPRLCFGVGTLMRWAPGHTHPLPTDSSVEIQQAIDAGFRHFNTGDIYTNNDSFAKVLRRSNLKRSEIVLSLKINTYASLGCRGRDHMIQAVKQEVERFGILEGYVDILQLHFPPRGYAGNMTNREAWRVLEDLKDQGLARIIGVSNWTLPDYHDIFNASDLKHPPQLNEYEFNPFLLSDPIFRQLREFEDKHNVVTMNYGVLTAINDRLPNQDSTALFQKLEEQSKQTKLSVADLLLSWAYDRLGGILVTSTSKADRARKTFELLSAKHARFNGQIYEEIEKAAALDGPEDFQYPTATYHESFGTPPHPATSLVFPHALIPQEPHDISFVYTTNFQTKHLQAKIAMSYLMLFGSLALLATSWLLSHIRSCLSLPGAYGPALARWTDAWYIWKIWQGKYEAYDIEAHRSGSRNIVRIGPRMYSIDDPAMARVIYGISSPLPKSKWYDAWGDPRIPNHNLFSARDRTVHGLMRRKVASMYSMSTIKSYEPYVDSCVALLLKRFDEFSESGKTFDLQQWMQCYAFDVIGEITFGRRVGFLESGGQDVDGIMRGLANANAFATLSGVNAVLLPILFILYGNPVRGIASFARKLQSESDEIDVKEKHGGETFLAKVQRLQKEDPEEYEKFRIRTITLTGNVAAGSDTTSISLTSALYHLLTTNGVSERMYEELDSQGFCSSLDEHITFDQAQQLPYLQMVIKEALRLHPAVGLPMWREVVGSGLDVDGTHFPPGALIGVNPWVAHRNADVFGTNAADFVPERWDPQHTSSETLAAMEQYYLPFGAGARTCIGKHISHLEMVKLIPELVRRYEFKCTSGELKTTNRWFVKPQKVLFSVRRRGTRA
ncbi:cytochrome P450 [Colletotrichum gloeosporioides Cg-14]|uniref:Cytochrome P450 n=1 Tax=Colletotrichum gloeosporioides (strain Cg-14) TaxID=1237896 RepID=T0LS75_COLGC|nr:cytochrome P450 [Colletotrichum gloeosporioides Cg-14]